MKIILSIIISLFISFIFFNNKLFTYEGIDWSITIPEGNWFYQNNLRKTPDFGYLLISSALDWYYTSNENLSLKLSLVSTFDMPIPIIGEPPWAFDNNYTGKGDSYTTASLISISRNHSILFWGSKPLLELGYGLAYVNKLCFIDQWKNGSIDTTESFRINKLEIDANFCLKFKFYGYTIGLNYLPTLLELSPELGYHYNHIIYIDIGGYVSFKSN